MRQILYDKYKYYEREGETVESYFWLILFIVFLIFEVITLGLATIWFAGGAFISFWMSIPFAREVCQKCLVPASSAEIRGF